jgi:hypothetical protein
MGGGKPTRLGNLEILPPVLKIGHRGVVSYFFKKTFLKIGHRFGKIRHRFGKI